MSAIIVTSQYAPAPQLKTSNRSTRIPSIDLLRGTVMIIMALDHVRDYFHNDAFIYDPTDLNRTSVVLFFTRLITHYCAPTFVFLAGISAYLYGAKRTKRELSYYLFTRGLWLVFAEFVITALAFTLNPKFPVVNLQVIWAIGVCMMILSALVHLKRNYILILAIILIAGHNLLDGINFPGSGVGPFLWAILHHQGDYTVGSYSLYVRYPLIPWIGIISLGYYLGSLYDTRYDAERRKIVLLSLGAGVIALFIILRLINVYGDPSRWSVQHSNFYTFLSMLNVTKYPPSLLYVLLTLGPSLIFLALSEKPLMWLTKRISVFGRTPFFYYIIHLYVIHIGALIGAVIQGYDWHIMILSDRVNRVPELKGYGFDLSTVYLIWIALIIFLYPFCKWFDKYKRANQHRYSWLTYL